MWLFLNLSATWRVFFGGKHVDFLVVDFFLNGALTKKQGNVFLGGGFKFQIFLYFQSYLGKMKPF